MALGLCLVQVVQGSDIIKCQSGDRYRFQFFYWDAALKYKNT